MAKKKQLPMMIETTEGTAAIEPATAEVIPMTPAKPKRSRKAKPRSEAMDATHPADVEPISPVQAALKSDLDAILTGKPVESDLAAIAEKHGAKVVAVVPASEPKPEPVPGPVAFIPADSGAESALAFAYNTAPTLAAKFAAVEHGAAVLGREDTTRLLAELEKARGSAEPAPFLLAVRLAVKALGFDKPAPKAPATPGTSVSVAQAKPKRERAPQTLEGGKFTIEKTVSQDGKGAAYLTNFKVPFAAGAKVRIVVEVIA